MLETPGTRYRKNRVFSGVKLNFRVDCEVAPCSLAVVVVVVLNRVFFFRVEAPELDTL